MLNNLDEAILNIGKTRKNQEGDPNKNDVLYSRWDKYYSQTIGDFYIDFIEPRLPDEKVVLAWHKMLIEYSQMDRAVFPIRDGNTSGKLRRGWLVKVDDHIEYKGKFAYVFTDNYFAAYIYKMALDGFCPSASEFFDFMTEFKDPSNIKWLQGREIKNDTYNNIKRKFPGMPIRFGQVGKSSSYPDETEPQKNAYINASPAPAGRFGEYGYKLAHIFAVKDKGGLYKIENTEIEWKNIGLVELGEETKNQQDYQWDDTICNFVWHRKMKDANERNKLREAVVAHFMRFLDPMNYFLAPKRGFNKFTKTNKDFSFDIAEYENLLRYLILIREKKYGKDFCEFKSLVLAPSGMSATNYSTERIEVTYNKKNQKSKTSTGATHTSSQKPGVGTPIRDEIIALLTSGKLSAVLIDSLKDADYCKKELKMNHPVLVELPNTYNEKRYYKAPCGKYLICNDWYKQKNRNHPQIFEYWKKRNGL